MLTLLSHTLVVKLNKSRRHPLTEEAPEFPTEAPTKNIVLPECSKTLSFSIQQVVDRGPREYLGPASARLFPPFFEAPRVADATGIAKG